MRLIEDGSCVELYNTSGYNLTMLASFGGGCISLEETLVFGCDERFTNPCNLANGTATYNCSAICSTPSLLLENYYTYHYCDPSPYNYIMVGDGLTFDAFNSVIPIINACMQQYCENPFTGLGGKCPWSNLTDSSEYLDSMCADVVTTVNLDVGGAGVSKGLDSDDLLGLSLMRPR